MQLIINACFERCATTIWKISCSITVEYLYEFRNGDCKWFPGLSFYSSSNLRLLRTAKYSTLSYIDLMLPARFLHKFLLKLFIQIVCLARWRTHIYNLNIWQKCHRLIAFLPCVWYYIALSVSCFRWNREANNASVFILTDQLLYIVFFFSTMEGKECKSYARP